MSQAGHERTVYYDTSRIVIDLTVDVHNTFGSSVHAHSLTGTDYHSVIDLTSDIDSSDESEGATCIFYDSTRTADSNFNCRSVRAEHELVIGKCKLKRFTNRKVSTLRGKVNSKGLKEVGRRKLIKQLKELRRLRTFAVSILNKISGSLECSVCFRNSDFPQVLPNCGHHFCGACLKELFDRNQDVDWRCPACRTVVHDQPVDLWLAKNINQLLLEAQAIFRCCGMNTVDIARPTDPRPRLKQLFDTTLRTDNADSFFDSLRARNRARRRFGRQAV